MEYDELVQQERDRLKNSFDVNTDTVGFVDAFRISSEQTSVATALLQQAQDTVLFEDDPDFDVSEHIDDLTEGVNPMHWQEFYSAGSLAEATAMKATVLDSTEELKTLSEAGGVGIGAMLMAGIIDVDTILSVGGSALAKVAKIPKALRIAEMSSKLSGVKGAFMTNGVAEAINASIRPTIDWRSVPTAALTGAGFVAGLGTVTKTTKRANQILQDARRGIDELDLELMPQHDSRGFMFTAKELDEYSASTPHEAIRKAAAQHVHNIEAGQSTKIADYIESLIETVMPNDFQRAWKSDSITLKALVYDLLEDSTGNIRNNNTAAAIEQMIQHRALQHSIDAIEQEYKKHLRKKGISQLSPEAHLRERENFYREMHEEIYSRRYGETSTRSADSPVMKAVDAVENQMNFIRVEGKRAGLDGFDEFSSKGYFPLIWSSSKVMDAVRVHGADNVTNAIAKSYAKSLDMPVEDATIFAKALITRMRSKEGAIDTNVQSMLTADGRKFFVDTLKNNGVSEEDADRILKLFTTPLEERGKSGRQQRRTEIDIRDSHEMPGSDDFMGGVLHIADLIEHDMPTINSKYVRDMAGRISLARKGIMSDLDKTDIIQTIRAEDATLSEDFLNDVFSYFSGGPVAGGVSEFTRRAKQFANLAVLSKLGLTQLAEYGPVAAAVGFSEFVKASPVLSKIFRKPTSASKELLDDLSAWTIYIDGLHTIYRPDLALDEFKTGVNASKLYRDVMRVADNAQHLQGYISGFYQIQKHQHRLAATSMTQKILKAVRDGEGVTPRFRDIGIDESAYNDLRKAIDDGYIEFDSNGNVSRVRLDDMPNKTAESFIFAINRHVDQTVQLGRAGETSTWMHRDVGSLLTHLKTFPLLALQKQLVRNFRFMDAQFALLAVYGSFTAGLAYTAKQLVDGNTDNLEYEDIMRGAFGMSTLTSWLPGLWDTGAGILGMNDYKFNMYSPKSGVELFNIPSFSILNRMSGLPGAAIHGINPWQELSNADIAALRMTPLIGNAYGVSAILNAMKE